VTAIRTFKDAAAGQDEAVVFVREVDVVDRMVRAQAMLDPACAAVFGVRQEAVVAGNPSMFLIYKVNRIEILATGTNAIARPAALRASDNRRDDQRAADECQNDFLSHCESEVLHINLE